jgi:predicted metal-dependent phosphoesterase TrpH
MTSSPYSASAPPLPEARSTAGGGSDAGSGAGAAHLPDPAPRSAGVTGARYDGALRLDLHIHSTASDGTLTPAAVVSAARAGGLHIIAIADHDTVSGVAEAQQAAAGSVHVIPALELSTRHAGGELHMLGYYVNPDDPALRSFGARAAHRREERMRDMIDRLDQAGVHVAYADVLAAAGPKPASIGRPHLARALVQRGYATTMADAFDRWIGDDGPAFVATRLLDPGAAIALIHAAGGIAVWAHPRSDMLEPLLPRLIEQGLDGLECYRPRMLPAETERIAALAARHQLVVTGGSDWHDDCYGPLGSFAVERDEVAAFLEIGGIWPAGTSSA